MINRDKFRKNRVKNLGSDAITTASFLAGAIAPRAGGNIPSANASTAGTRNNGLGVLFGKAGQSTFLAQTRRNVPIPVTRRRIVELVEYCPYIGIASVSRVDLFSSKLFSVTTGTEYGVATNEFVPFDENNPNARNTGKETEWFNIAITGNDVVIYEKNTAEIGTATFSSAPNYVGDIHAASEDQWYDGNAVTDAFITNVAFLRQDTLNIPIGFDNYLEQSFREASWVTPSNPAERRVFAASNAGSSSSLPANARVTVFVIGQATSDSFTRINLEREKTYSLAGRSRTLAYGFVRDQVLVDGSAVSANPQALGGGFLLFSNSAGASFDRWEYTTRTTSNQINALMNTQAIVGFKTVDSGNQVANQDAEPEIVRYEGNWDDISTFTLDTPVSDADAYFLFFQGGTTTSTTDIRAQLGSGGAITIRAFINQLEAAPGHSSTVYEQRDVSDPLNPGPWLPGSPTSPGMPDLLSELLDEVSGAGGLTDVQGLTQTTTNDIDDSITYRNTLGISHQFTSCYLCASNPDGSYNVYSLNAIASPSYQLNSNTQEVVGFSQLSLSGIFLELENVPWWPNAVPGRDVLCTRNAAAIGLTPQNTVMWSDEQAFQINGGGGES